MAATLGAKTFAGKVAFISGGSRGIGLAIGVALAKHGANVAIAAKTDKPHPKLPGTIHTALEEIRAASPSSSSRHLSVLCDIRSEDSVLAALDKTVAELGGIDILVNNASAINIVPVADMPTKSFDLIAGINARGTFLVSKHCIPHLVKSAEKGHNPHILTLAPPLRENVIEDNFRGSTGYSIGKFSMSLLTLGLAGELREHGVGVNALWPLSLIETAAVSNVLRQGGGMPARSTDILADTGVAMLAKDGRTYTGQFEIDELFLRRELGYKTADLRKYAPHLETDFDLGADLFIPQWVYDERDNMIEAEGSKAKL